MGCGKDNLYNVFIDGLLEGFFLYEDCLDGLLQLLEVYFISLI